MEKKPNAWLPHMRRIGGTTIFIVGVVALPLPIIPGTVLIALSLYILSLDSPDVHARVVAVRARYRLLDLLLVPGDKLLGHQPPPRDEPLPFPKEKKRLFRRRPGRRVRPRDVGEG